MRTCITAFYFSLSKGESPSVLFHDWNWKDSKNMSCFVQTCDQVITGTYTAKILLHKNYRDSLWIFCNNYCRVGNSRPGYYCKNQLFHKSLLQINIKVLLHTLSFLLNILILSHIPFPCFSNIRTIRSQKRSFITWKIENVYIFFGKFTLFFQYTYCTV